jgi:hypothetical protein
MRQVSVRFETMVRPHALGAYVPIWPPIQCSADAGGTYSCGVVRHTAWGLAARGLGHLDAPARDTALPIAACVHTGHPVR